MNKTLITILVTVSISSSAYAENLMQKYQQEKSQTLSQIEQLQVGRIDLQRQIMQLETKVGDLTTSCNQDSNMVNVSVAGFNQSLVAGVLGARVTPPTYNCQELKDTQRKLSEKKILSTKVDFLITQFKKTVMVLDKRLQPYQEQ